MQLGDGRHQSRLWNCSSMADNTASLQFHIFHLPSPGPTVSLRYRKYFQILPPPRQPPFRHPGAWSDLVSAPPLVYRTLVMVQPKAVSRVPLWCLIDKDCFASASPVAFVSHPGVIYLALVAFHPSSEISLNNIVEKRRRETGVRCRDTQSPNHRSFIFCMFASVPGGGMRDCQLPASYTLTKQPLC